MKYAIVIPDGCADEPQESLGGKTPLAAADTPAMDAIAAAGLVCRASHVPASLPPGSDVANMSLLGYDPLKVFSGRAPLEAAAQGIELAPEDWAIRCNLVTIEHQTMRDFTAGHISTAEAAALLADLQDVVAASDLPYKDALQFVPGVSYRNLLLWRGARSPAPFSQDTRTVPPHDLTDKSVIDDHPRGPGGDALIELMTLSMDLFADHPVNEKRIDEGKLPATNVWLWGQGSTPKFEPFAQVYGLKGTMITAVDLLRGLASLIGWQRIEVPGATGYTDTDYAAKGQYAIDALPETDIICVHVEATDEASHEGDLAAKMQALHEIDQKIVAPLHAALKAQGDYRIMVLPDHPTPIRTKTHSHGAVPVAICGSGVEVDDNTTYSDEVAAASPRAFDEGWKLMSFFLK